MLRKPYALVGRKLYKCVAVVMCLALTWVRGVTLSMEEKSGGAARCQSQMDRFWGEVNLCGFKDQGYTRTDFTWCNMQSGDSRVY